MTGGPIVLLTDFGLADHYVGTVKGVILSIHPGACIVDLSHGVAPQNVAQAAVLLETSYRIFPKKSIFCCVVDPGVGTGRKILCIRTSCYYFLAPDNGLLSLVLKHEKDSVIRLVENPEFFRTSLPSATFHGRDIFSPTAAHLAKRDIFARLGPKVSKIHPLQLAQVKKSKKRLEGEILYFDHFGNAMTNIHEQDQTKDFWRGAEVFAREIPLGTLRATYGAGPRVLSALFNSSSQLEIAMPGGSAQKEASLEAGDSVIVKERTGH